MNPYNHLQTHINLCDPQEGSHKEILSTTNLKIHFYWNLKILSRISTYQYFKGISYHPVPRFTDDGSGAWNILPQGD